MTSMTLNQNKNEYLERLDMTYPNDKDSDSYKQEYYRHMQEKSEIEKLGKLKRKFNSLKEM